MLQQLLCHTQGFSAMHMVAEGHLLHLYGSVKGYYALWCSRRNVLHMPHARLETPILSSAQLHLLTPPTCTLCTLRVCLGCNKPMPAAHMHSALVLDGDQKVAQTRLHPRRRTAWRR